MLHLRVSPRYVSLAAFAWGTLSMVGCGSDAAPADTTPTGPSPTSSATSSTPPSDAGLSAAASDLPGLWDVSGKDDRGTYTGQIEIRADKAGKPGVYSFIRTVRYEGVTVEGDRELHWLFRGTLKKVGSGLTLESSLKRLDFITSRGTTKRTATDGPVPLTGTFSFGVGQLTGTITGAGVSLADTWKAQKPLGAAPIFEDKRSLVPAHSPPSATEKQTNFSLYSNYHTLDVIKPYVPRPEFQAAVHGHVIDKTDLDFYRANKKALRVVDKVVDEISLGETLARADAFRHTMKEKAELYDKAAEERFIDPEIGMIPHGGAPGAGYSGQVESFDGALWTAVYLAGQVFRFQVTGEPKAKANVVLTLDALLKLQEMTGDWKQFARTLRKATGSPQPPWYAGTGANANLEWLAGGNNDMIKGLFYGYLMGWELLCEGGKTGHEALCARVRTNAKHLADDVQLGGSNAPASAWTNKLPAAWLYAVVTDNSGDALSYKTTAEGYWLIGKPALAATPVTYTQGIVDWSGTHLTSIGDMIQVFLAKRMDLGGNAVDAMRSHIDASHKNLEKQRFPTWHLLKAAFGSGAGATSPFIKDALSRMEEAQYPKVSFTIDRSLNPEFCMSPYPSLPWKGDWMNYPASDRTQGLNSHPLFEGSPDVMYWKVGNGYRSGEGYEAPGGDYLHLYWLARKYGLIGPND